MTGVVEPFYMEIERQLCVNLKIYASIDDKENFNERIP
jgi:hypothetical protein